MWFIMEDIDLLHELGYDVTIAAGNQANETHTLKEIDRRGARFKDIRCDYSSLFNRENLLCLRQYREWLKHERFELIICHTTVLGLIARIAAARQHRQGTKVIYFTHGILANELSSNMKRTLLRVLETTASRFCDAIITINDDDYNEVLKWHVPHVYKVNGVGCDVAKYMNADVDRAELRKSIGVSDSEIMVMMVGSICSRKNHIVIARALSLLENCEKYHLVICGRAEPESPIVREIESLSATHGFKLTFLGFRNDIEKLVHAADIGAIPSLREGLGMAGIQQLCAGVPMVGTAVQGIKEYIIPGKTGFTVANPHDAAAFAEAIKACSDPGFRNRVKNDCMAVAQEFSLEKSIRQRREIYSTVVGR
jgi:hypothetical protein